MTRNFQKQPRAVQPFEPHGVDLDRAHYNAVTMTEQNGIDILCDAASSDLLSTTALSLSLSTPAQQQQQQQQRRPSQTQAQEQEQESPPSKRVKRSDTSSTAVATHICHICQRVYERADHLTRHLRSHENARPYQCTRCPKRFNRADLLTRHESTHDRDDGKSRPFIRRSDRATQACEACAAAKAKCDDQKPCGRCQAKKLVCQNSKRGYQYKTAHEDSYSDSASLASAMGNTSFPPGPVPLDEGSTHPEAFAIQAMAPDDDPMVDPIADEMAYFNPMLNLFQDIDLEMSWDLNFDAFSIPPLDVQGPSPQSSNTNISATRSSTRNALRDPSRGHAAFKRSPWLWEPKHEDYVRLDKQGLDIDEQSLAQSSAFGRFMDRPSRKLRINAHQRDRIFAIVLAQNKDPTKVPSFPTLDLLNYLLQASFVRDEYQLDSWIHAPSFDPDATMPELLAAILANGATFISVPAIWQFGMALQEVVRLGMATAFEASNAKTRNLDALQAFMLSLDIGLWSGFKRKMEIAESFSLPLLTMIRRAGTFSVSVDSPSLIPLESDAADVVETKWRKFITRESYKRLALHLFAHDVQTSISLQTNPLVSCTELSFSLPASRDLWRAPTAESWRQSYLSKRNVLRPIPRVSDAMHNLNILDELQELIDVELCYSVLLNGFWGQISAYRGSLCFFANADSHGGTHSLWLKSQHQELYQHLCAFSTIIHTSGSVCNHRTHLALVLELFLMVLHVSPDELQRFAGKAGEDESRRAAASLEAKWVNTPEARYTIWHAGQVFLNARQLPPASLRGFHAIAVYLASLSLWVYGLLNCSNMPTPTIPYHHQAAAAAAAAGDEQDPAVAAHLQPPGACSSYQQQQQQQQQQNGASRGSPPPQPSEGGATKFILLDGEETRETKAFLQFGRGVAALTTSGGAVESLSNPAAVLLIARDIFRENFPVRSENLPPLVESLANLLRDLGSGVGISSSRVVSNVASRMGSEER